MKWWCLPVCVFLVLTGRVLALEVNVEEGGHFVLNLQTLSFDVSLDTAKCDVVTPQKETIQLFPEDQSPERFAVGVPNFNVGCSVTVSEAAESDSGAWELQVETSDGATKWNDTIQVTVTKADDDPEIEYTTIRLEQIDYVVRPGMSISVTLSHEGGDVGCFVKHPESESAVVLSELDIAGVVGRESSSFIACGIQIGPIDDSFLGVWELCSRNRTRTSRCQPANIIFANNDWQPSTIAPLTYSVNTGSYVTPQLSTSGVPSSCHIITPNGDDLAVIASSNYPGIQRDASYESSCRFNLGPVNQDLIGTWTIYGRFEQNLVISEIQQTVVLYSLTDTEEPESEYTKITLEQIDYVVRPGMSISVSLSQEGGDVGCFVTHPEGESVALSELDIAGVVGRESSSFIACGIQIGPIDDSFLGVWELCARNRTRTSRCQPANIIFANNDWQPSTIAPSTYSVSTGSSVFPELSSSGVPSSCHIVTPNGDDLAVIASSNYPGIQRDASYASSCRFNLGPVNQDLIGTWTIYGRFEQNLVISEIQQTVVLYSLTDTEEPESEYTKITLEQIDYVVRPGMSISVSLSQEGGDVGCFVTHPEGESVALSELDIAGVVGRESSSFIACGIQIGPIDDSFLGVWELCARNRTRTSRCQPANIIFANNDWQPSTIAPSTYSVIAGSFVFPELSSSDGVPSSCHIVTPNGDDLAVIASSNYPGIQRDASYASSCRFNLGPVNQDLIGTWTIYGRFEQNLVISEIQQTVIVYSQTGSEIMTAVPASVTISEGSDLYIRLSASTSFYQSCKLLRPDDTEALLYKIDEKYTEYCGFIVPQVTSSDTGLWSIVIENGSIFKTTSDVHVVKRWEGGSNNFFTWVKDRPVQETVGPEDAVYCKVEDPRASTIFEGFGKCKIDLEKVTSDHHGFWKMHVASPGRVLTDEHLFLVEVSEPVAKSVVVAHVSVEKPDVMLSCSLSTDEEVKACKFRDPSGKILLANHGVGEDRYVFHGTGVNVRSTGDNHECGIRITNPLTTDLGLWRCAVQTDADEYYGFLTVLCPWAMMDPVVAAAVVSEPTLTAVSPTVSALEGDSVTLSCSVQAPIRYCYFRARNGSVFNIHPASSSESMQYVGTGLEAGECGIRFSSLQASESGAWSCHVGLTNATAPEQRADISVHVDEPLVADQRHENGWLIVEGTVPSNRQIEYCRFVRMDGVGFTTENLPEGYVSSGDHTHGMCMLHVPNPSILEHHPWTVVVKISGQDEEIARITPHTFSLGDITGSGGIPAGCLYFMVIVLTVAVTLAAVMLIPKKNRNWTFRKANSLRDSIRSSFRSSLVKKPLPTTVEAARTPEVA